MPITSARWVSAASRIAETGCLMPMLTTLKPLLVKMMSTRFLPMSWTSPLTVARTMVPLPSSSVRSMCGSSHATAAFITSADCSTNGSCISPRPNSSPTTFMPSSRWSLTMSRALLAGVQGRLQVGVEPVALAVDDAPGEPLAQRQRRQLLGARGAHGRGVDALEQVEEALQRVVGLLAVRRRAPPVVDQVERDLARAPRRSWSSAGSWRRARSPSPGPAFTHSWRNTEFSTMRAAGLTPNETFDRPSVVWTVGVARA